jgi:hypothetical protein
VDADISTIRIESTRLQAGLAALAAVDGVS